MHWQRLSPTRWMVWQWWLCLTAIYVGYFSLDRARGVTVDASPIVIRAVGLFVPVGFLSAVFGLASRWFVGFLVLAAVFAFFADRSIRRAGLKGWKLVASCLATLLVVTFIVDLSWYFSDLGGCFWPSLQILRGALHCGKW